MAINALGLPLQLQTSPLQLQDLLSGLNPGDLLKERIVELLPQQQAIVNLRGQNVVAQLPSGQALVKGDLLSLQVTQAAPAQNGQAAALTLRLLPPAEPLQAQALAPAAPGLPPQAQLDQALSAARVPSTPISQTVVRTLAQAGVPLTPQAIQTAVQAVERLIAAEQPQSNPPTATLPEPIQAALQDAVAQLKVAAPLTPPGPPAMALQEALKVVSAALEPQPAPAPAPSSQPQTQASANSPATLPSTPAQTSAPAPAPAPILSAAPAPVQGSPTPPAAPVQAGGNALAPVVPTDIPAIAQQIKQAVAQVQAQPTPQNVQALRSLIEALPTVIASAAPLQAQAPVAPANSAAPTSSQTPSTQPLAPLAEAFAVAAPQPAATAAQTPAVAVVQREALAPLLNAVTPQSQPLTLAAVQAQASQLSQALSDPTSVPAQRLVQAVQAQIPQAEPAAILHEGLKAVHAFSDALQALPPATSFEQPVQLQQVAQDAGLATPRVPLQSLPLETVAEAVAWLQARDLPPQRPLVEAVAVFLQQDHDALPAAQRAVAQAEALPPQVLESQPELKSAVHAARQALQDAAIHPEQPQLSERLQQWASQQGLDLELRLAEGKSLPEAAAPVPQDGPTAAAPARPGLRPALQHLEQQLRQALREQPSESAPALQSVLHEAQTATRALSAVPLQSQSAPAFDTVHLPLPVALGQAFGGQLSVTWRQGRERALNEKDPVSVAVALNTGELGTVKVLLQVWKGAASARVIAEDPETADFLAAGADELKAGFADRTPFKLQALDFDADDDGAGDAGNAPVPPVQGLTLSA